MRDASLLNATIFFHINLGPTSLKVLSMGNLDTLQSSFVNGKLGYPTVLKFCQWETWGPYSLKARNVIFNNFYCGQQDFSIVNKIERLVPV